MSVGNKRQAPKKLNDFNACRLVGACLPTGGFSGRQARPNPQASGGIFDTSMAHYWRSAVKGAGTPKRPGGGWRGSAAQIAVGRASIIRWNRTRHLQPRCGAARKRDGEPCQNLAMANGRCRCHGGKTGKGKDWHRPVWPQRDTPGAMTKLNKKLSTLERAAAKRVKRVAAMTPEQRERHEAWQRAHKPGSAAARQRAKAERKQRAAVRKMLSEQPRSRPAPSDEVTELERLIADRKAELARAMAKTNDPGAFG
ncbi:hypothetical protein ACFSQQ_28645 [Mesorhizobium kowhaii]|uniref:hypothetical protein n=1 Tax=Mesorhizobium kowhaii TaxID=1300272 RepID=UPI0035EE4612